jgi:hypothetical protein
MDAMSEQRCSAPFNNDTRRRADHHVGRRRSEIDAHGAVRASILVKPVANVLR